MTTRVRKLARAWVVERMAARPPCRRLCPSHAQRRWTHDQYARILVLGGGFAALEAAFLLRMRLRDRVEIKLVSDSDQFLFRPNSIYVPFGADPASLLVGPAQAASAGGTSPSSAGTVAEVDPDAQARHAGRRPAVRLRQAGRRDRRGHPRRGGAGPRGARGHDLDVRLDARRAAALRAGARARARAASAQRVLFLVPPNNKCSGPLYEIVMMLETWLRRRGRSRQRRDHVVDLRAVVHPGLRAAAARRWSTDEFAERGIEGHTEEVVDRGARRRGPLRRRQRARVRPPDRVPALRGRGSLQRLPSDERGFIEVRAGDPAGGRARRRVCARGCGRLPDQAGLPGVPAGRRRRRSHRRRGRGEGLRGRRSTR